MSVAAMVMDMKLSGHIHTNKKEWERMFFWKMKVFLKCSYKIVLKASLRACHKQFDPNKCDIFDNPIRIKKKHFKRTFSPALSYQKASMCLEAALAFSFFLLFFTNVLSLLFLFMVYVDELTSLQQQGKKQAAYAYVTEEMLGVKEENICLDKLKKVESVFPLFSIPDCKLHMRCVVKPWTGYDVTKGKNGINEEIIVYMTEHGSVYHKNRSCTHLSLSIQAVSYIQVDDKRNESGESYKSCEYCANDGIFTIVFITSYGNRYHSTTKCQGLKRSVRSLPLSEAEGIKPCSKCG